MFVIAEQFPELFADASAKLGGHYSHERGHKIISALAPDGQPLAYAVFTGVGEHKAEITVWAAGEHGLGGRRFLRAVFRTAFVQWKLKRLSAVIALSNRRSHDAARRLGFIPETPVRRWFGDEDGVLYLMFPEHCRWLGKE